MLSSTSDSLDSLEVLELRQEVQRLKKELQQKNFELEQYRKLPAIAADKRDLKEFPVIDRLNTLTSRLLEAFKPQDFVVAQVQDQAVDNVSNYAVDEVVEPTPTEPSTEFADDSIEPHQPSQAPEPPQPKEPQQPPQPVLKPKQEEDLQKAFDNKKQWSQEIFDMIDKF